MRFCEFLKILYENSHKPSPSLYVMQLFSSLCGEESPLTKNKLKPVFLASQYLPDGLKGSSPTSRMQLFGDHKKYKGISQPVKDWICGKENKDTFVLYLNKTLSPELYAKLCSGFSVSENTERSVLFEAVFLYFTRFLYSPDDNVESSVSDIIGKELFNKKDTSSQKLDGSEPVQKNFESANSIYNISQTGEETDATTLSNMKILMTHLADSANEYNSKLNVRGLFPCSIIEKMEALYTVIIRKKFYTEKVQTLVEQYEEKHFHYKDYIMEHTCELDFKYRRIHSSSSEVLSELEKRKNELLRVVSRLERLAEF